MTAADTLRPGKLLPGTFRPLAAALVVGCVALTTVLALLSAGRTRPGWLDTAVDRWVQGSLGRHPYLLNPLANLGTAVPVIIMIAALVLTCAALREWRAAILAAAATPAASACTELVLKPLVGRRLNGALSFPSGHATSLFALAVSCGILLTGPRLYRVPRALRVAATVAAVLIATAVATAMVGLDAHYFTDAIGGAAVGTGVTLSCALILDRIPASRRPAWQTLGRAPR